MFGKIMVMIFITTMTNLRPTVVVTKCSQTMSSTRHQVGVWARWHRKIWTSSCSLSSWWHCRIINLDFAMPVMEKAMMNLYLKSDIFCKISKNFFRPWARHRLSLPVAKATLIADRRQRNCQKLPDPVCFKHFSLFRLSTVFTYLYFWASASSSCLKSVDKELEA